MKLKLKPEFIDVFMSCPFTGKIINLTFLEKELYLHYYYKGHTHLFDVIDEKEKKKKD
jgi:hypothetical protein